MLHALLLYLSAASLLVAVGFEFAFLRAIKQRHHAAWVELGSRGLFAGASPRSNARLSWYLWRRAYRSLHDPAIDRLARGIWVFSVLSAASFVILASLLLAAYL